MVTLRRPAARSRRAGRSSSSTPKAEGPVPPMMRRALLDAGLGVHPQVHRHGARGQGLQALQVLPALGLDPHAQGQGQGQLLGALAGAGVEDAARRRRPGRRPGPARRRRRSRRRRPGSREEPQQGGMGVGLDGVGQADPLGQGLAQAQELGCGHGPGCRRTAGVPCLGRGARRRRRRRRTGSCGPPEGRQARARPSRIRPGVPGVAQPDVAAPASPKAWPGTTTTPPSSRRRRQKAMGSPRPGGQGHASGRSRRPAGPGARPKAPCEGRRRRPPSARRRCSRASASTVAGGLQQGLGGQLGRAGRGGDHVGVHQPRRGQQGRVAQGPAHPQARGAPGLAHRAQHQAGRR